jgi:neutral ceramidase
MFSTGLRRPSLRLLLCLPAVGLIAAACEEPESPLWAELEAGTLVAGAHGGYLDLPVGLPLGGFTSRDRALGDSPPPDQRDSDYVTDFVPSGGWQTRIPLNALWLSDGTRDAVIIEMDVIYSSDEVTERIGRALTDALGRDLTDSVFTITNHSHSSYGDFNPALMFSLGTDFHREEIIQRMSDQAAAAALAAHEAAVPAAMGMGIDPAYDPIGVDQLFQDRRAENDDLLGPGGAVTGPGWKDERLTLLRVDGVDGSPIAAWFNFGMHGTVEGGDNAMISTEAPGHVAMHLNAQRGGPVWMFGQGAGGDASPAGRFDSFARMEWIGKHGAEGVFALWEATATSAEPITLEPLQRYVTQDRSMKVTRDGAVNLEYMPWNPQWSEWPYIPDMQIWDAEGNILSPLDEFWAQYGAALCGEPSIDIAILGLDVDLPMYRSCIDMDRGYALFRIAFREYMTGREVYDLPMRSTRTAMIGALGIQSIPVTVLGEPDAAVEPVVFAFAPGEPTTLWTQFLRHRANAEHGIARTVVVGYAMDHEGYLLTVDDWLLGGYEPSIVVWGPLAGEHLLERLLDLTALAGTTLAEDANYPDFPGETDYRDWNTPIVEPDVTPLAGTVPEVVPEQLYLAGGAFPDSAQPASEVPRIQGIATFTFESGDPALGLVSARLERESAPDTWEPVTTPGGVPIDDALADMLVTYTPQPLRGTDGADPVREHYHHVRWQAVDIWGGTDTLGALPLGNYRFAVDGLTRDPASATYPYASTPWTLRSEPFEVVPAALAFEAIAAQANEVAVSAAYAPAAGWRMVHDSSSPETPTPLSPSEAGPSAAARPEAGGDDVALSVTSDGDSGDWTALRIDTSALTAGGWVITLNDGHGNVGEFAATVP